jgi:vacuolar iron transporter family protein
MIETQDTVHSDPVSVPNSIFAIFEPYDLPDSTIDNITSHLSRSSKLPEFLMRFQHTLEAPAESRAMTCALTIALGYFIGGFIPLHPYFFVKRDQMIAALCCSVVIIFIALFTFGYIKTCFVSGWRGSTNIRNGILGGFENDYCGKCGDWFCDGYC